MVELLVALMVTGLITAATLTIALSSRDMLELDRQRTAVNQNLRAGIDLLGVDLRRAGERLPHDAPAIEIVDGDSGSPDTLVLRRNRLDSVLPVCENIAAGSSVDSVFVAKDPGTGTVPPGCAPVPDENGDGWPDNLETWRDHRVSHGGSVVCYIFNPVTGQGEFFVYDGEDSATFHLHKANGDSWQFDYQTNQNPRVYVLEQRTFRIDDETLQLVINQDAPLNLVGGIEDFQARAVLRDGSVRVALGATDDWTDLRAIEVTLAGHAAPGRRAIDRAVTTRLFPRNVLSH